MEFETFKIAVKSEFEKKLGSKAMLDIKNMQKNNTSYDGLLVVTDLNKANPVLNLDDMYDMYCETGNFEKVINESMNLLQELLSNPIENSFSFQKNKVVFQLIRKKGNKKLLKNIPHRNFLDLAIVYRVLFSTEKVMMSSLVENDFMEKLGLTESVLYELALENTKRELPVKISDINEMLGLPNLFDMYIITNEKNYYGAGSVLCPNVLFNFASKKGCNLIMLPSSVHEWILLPDNGNLSPSMYADMVQNVNKKEVAIQDVLSDHAYYYDREKDEMREL